MSVMVLLVIATCHMWGHTELCWSEHRVITGHSFVPSWKKNLNLRLHWFLFEQALQFLSLC